ncbi:MAG: ABC transporter ATP-binding protein [Candidatus Micrarchaeales archaeon]
MDNSIRVSGIVKRFGNTIALNKLNFSSIKGINIILGPNGAGKSTLLRCIDGLYRVDSGSVVVNGVDPYKNDLLKSKLSLLTDNYALYDFLSVRNNMKFFGRLYGLKDEATLARTRETLKDLEALEYLDKKIYELSRGTKQKVAFCRAVLNEPDVILLDEPTAFLDAHSAEMVRKILFGYEKEGKVVVFVTQKLDEVTRFNGKISIIKKGHIVKETTTEGLYNVVLKNTLINIRLAHPLKSEAVKRIAGFSEANKKDATFLKFKVKNYKDINRIIKEILARGGSIVSIDYIEHLIDDLSK